MHVMHRDSTEHSLFTVLLVVLVRAGVVHLYLCKTSQQQTSTPLRTESGDGTRADTCQPSLDPE